MSRFLHPRYQALEAYTPGEQPRDMAYIKLNTNESPYPPAPSVRAVLNEDQGALLRLYPDPTGKALRESLGALYGLGPENVLLANGSDEVLNFAFMAYGGDGAVFPEISYGFYQVFADLYGIPAEKIPLKDDFSLDVPAFCGKNALVVIANPNAPTGMGVGLEALERIVANNQNHVVVVDEAYVDFGGQTALPLLAKYENLLICRTFSKSRCLAGGRLGFALANPGLIADLEKLRYSTNPYNVNRLTLALGEATVAAERYYQDRCADIQKTRSRTAAALEALGFQVLPSQTNFLFVRSDRVGGLALYQELKRRGILVRHFTTPKIADFNRVTIGTPEQMGVFIETVQAILAG